MDAQIIAVCTSGDHRFSKERRDRIVLIPGEGVEGDCHRGKNVKHRSRVARDPSMPNLRQVHLIHVELLNELRAKGFVVSPGEMGENVTTTGLDLLGLPTGTRLFLGREAVITVTGLRNPCLQIDNFQSGMMAAVLDRDADGNLIRKAGVMAIVDIGGEVRPGDGIRVELPTGAFEPLKPV